MFCKITALESLGGFNLTTFFFFFNLATIPGILNQYGMGGDLSFYFSSKTHVDSDIIFKDSHLMVAHESKT